MSVEGSGPSGPSLALLSKTFHFIFQRRGGGKEKKKWEEIGPLGPDEERAPTAHAPRRLLGVFRIWTKGEKPLKNDCCLRLTKQKPNEYGAKSTAKGRWLIGG